MRISDRFPRGCAPDSDRVAIQLTSGPGFCYPLYYFIPSITADGRYLVHHRSDGENVQLHRVDLATGETAQLTDASWADTQWHPWDIPAGRGVLDHRSALNVATAEAIYFDGNEVRAVGVGTREERTLFELPADRVAIGQNCCSPDGRFFFFIHHDRDLYREIYGEPGGERRGGYAYPRHLSRGTKLARLDLETGEHRTVIAANSPIHHVQPYGDDKLVFSSLAVERAILVTDYAGGWYTHLRTQADDGGTTCHYCVTERGILYEAHSSAGLVAGVVDLEKRRPLEAVLPASVQAGSSHVAADPSGRRLLLECHDDDHGHTLVFVRRLVGSRGGADGEVELDYLFGDWPTYGSGQKSHFHPRVTDDGEHLIITAGDPSSGTNHVFALDIADLPETRFAFD
ncbi:MAG: TolB family protein [Spirochaetota bacterium]